MNSNGSIRISKLSLLAVLFALPVLNTGCLETRSTQKEVEEKQVLRSQMANLQRSTADVNARFQDIEDDIRKLNGRLETVENRVQQTLAKADQGSQAVEGKLQQNDSVYREEFKALRAEIEDLKAQISGMREEQSKAAQAQAKAAAAQAAKNPFELAEEQFEQKNWKEAILDYEKYRKGNPKGKQFATATYKIGVSFQELGLVDEAKSFYEEVVSKFPKSKDAEKATSRLKKLKKK